MTIGRAWSVALVGIGIGIGTTACGGNVRPAGDDVPTAGAAGAAAGPTVVGSGVGGASGMGGAGTAGSGGSAAIPPPLACAPGRSEPLWLNNPAYDNTIRDLLGDTSLPSRTTGFPEDEKDIGFRRNVAQADRAGVWQSRLAHFVRGAEVVVARARDRLGEILPCDPVTAGEDACARAFIDDFGRRAFRRPITAEERTAFVSTYDEGRLAGGFGKGIENVLWMALTSLHFLQIEETGAAGVTRLGPYAVASRLSYFVYRSMPDPELFAAAASGQLANPGEIERQVVRMLADPKAHPAVIDFFSEWLGLDRLTGSPWTNAPGVTKDPAIAPDFATVRNDMRAETEKFGESVFFGDGQLSTLLTSTASWVNEPLAAIYGIGGIAGVELRKAALDPSTRAGFLTQPSLLSMLATSHRGSPSARGSFVSQKLFCSDIPPPPASLEEWEPMLRPGGTYREALDAAVAGAPCRACHVYLEGIGYGMDEFDAVGRYRTTENMLPIDNSGRLPFDVAQPSFRGAVELAKRLVSASEVRACMAKQWFRFALSRREGDEDECSLRGIQRNLQETGSLRDLVVAIATSGSFLQARW